MTLSRASRHRLDDPQNVPRSIEQDLVTVDTTWGEIQPLEPVPGVRTVGELEVMDLVEAGAWLVDTRVPDSRSGVTIFGALNVPHDQVRARVQEFHSAAVSILFCNGPQCPQTPDALRSLAEVGFPLDRLAYYRGGLHDWVTLALPTAQV